MGIEKAIEKRLTRCAIYTRKSTTAGLDMEVNSLESQREVCRAYIKCQAHRNWVELPHEYDDGGFSGGSLERPALKRLIEDIEAGRIDIIVVYKIDRLSRSLTDFVRLIDVLNRFGASFVSVTQTFDTSDSMGRLVLNILLTFAQFERELMSDRVRDKKAAMRRKGLFVGGLPPFGYVLDGAHLVVEAERGDVVREIFRRYPQETSRPIVKDLARRGCVTRSYVSRGGNAHGGQPITTATLFQILKNPIYTGYFVHRGEWIRAQHKALITREEWDRAQAVRRSRHSGERDCVRNFLLGLLHDETGRRMRMQIKGPGRSNGFRYYKADASRWGKRDKRQRILVNADRVEALAKSAINALLVDRIQVNSAVLSLGLYSQDIKRLLNRGREAARRLTLLDAVQLRNAFLALVPRLEVTRTELRLYVSCYELSRFLAWDGIGLFDKSRVQPTQGADRVHVLSAPAFLITGHPFADIPVSPCENCYAAPDEYLVGMLRQAMDVRQCVLSNRTRTLREMASAMGMGQNMFARLLRLNYLAPDIQAAIMDGTQPPGITRRAILFGSLPLDWGQQRALLGFG